MYTDIDLDIDAHVEIDLDLEIALPFVPPSESGLVVLFSSLSHEAYRQSSLAVVPYQDWWLLKDWLVSSSRSIDRKPSLTLRLEVQFQPPFCRNHLEF